MAATATLIPVEQYLNTVYRPDCDYIEGEVQERNMGEVPHGTLQAFLAFFFRSHRDQWNVQVLTETRLQVAPQSFRIPDLMVRNLDRSEDRIVRAPPLLCIEILSSEDRMVRVQERLDDYARMGVRSMWIIDPWRGTAFTAGPDAILQEIKDVLTVPDTPIAISVAEIFAELER